MVRANVHKYSVSALCNVLQIPRSTYYYEAAEKADQSELTAMIIEIFRTSRNNYGTRKLKRALSSKGFEVSRRKIAMIMKSNGLVSNYTVAQFRPGKDKGNESKAANILDRQFQDQPYRHVVVSDLTYVRVGSKWNYICILVDLYNREIIGYSAGAHKTAALVQEAFRSVRESLYNIQLFHTDRGNEFKNAAIDETLASFRIQRSLSHKGSPHDNAVAEATFKLLKTEFVRNRNFEGLDQLKLQLTDYVNWFNHHRLHSTLNYVTPVQYRLNALKKVV